MAMIIILICKIKPGAFSVTPSHYIKQPARNATSSNALTFPLIEQTIFHLVYAHPGASPKPLTPKHKLMDIFRITAIIVGAIIIGLALYMANYY